MKVSVSFNRWRNMLKGREGAGQHTYDRIAGRTVRHTRKYAVYLPVYLGNTFWSIVVVSAEQDMLARLISFKKQVDPRHRRPLHLWQVFSTLGAKAWLIVQEERRRKRNSVSSASNWPIRKQTA
jgi:hypothetical protein